MLIRKTARLSSFGMRMEEWSSLAYMSARGQNSRAYRPCQESFSALRSTNFSQALSSALTLTPPGWSQHSESRSFCPKWDEKCPKRDAFQPWAKGAPKIQALVKLALRHGREFYAAWWARFLSAPISARVIRGFSKTRVSLPRPSRAQRCAAAPP